MVLQGGKAALTDLHARADADQFAGFHDRDGFPVNNHHVARHLLVVNRDPDSAGRCEATR